jgi:chemotaxis signal transduction protein
MDLLLSTTDLREVVAPAPVAPLPGRTRGIQGVMIYQGEFMPVLAWEHLPGCGVATGPPVALAVLRPRLALPIERLVGMISPPTEAWQEAGGDDAHGPWLGGICRVGDLSLLLVDADRLISLLQRFREDQ